MLSGFMLLSTVNAQISVSGPLGVYGAINVPETVILNGGDVFVGNNGNWQFSGNLTGAHKGDGNTPNTIGQSETITFDGSGTYTNPQNFIVDGYVSVSNKTTSFILPIGNSTTAYNLTAPAGANISAAYFSGNGLQQTATIPYNTTTAIVFSPFIDMPLGISAGNYTFTYPDGFNSQTYSSLLSSNNTSAAGTDANTEYSLLANVTKFATTSGSSMATLPAGPTTQVYFASSSVVLPVNLINFTAIKHDCLATLNWQTASETNSSFYGLEHSIDGSTFNLVQKVKSNNSVTGSTYHATYPLTFGSNYFRLKMIDKDGSFGFSSTIAVTASLNCGSINQVKISPNPASNIVTIQGSKVGDHILLSDINNRQLAELLSAGNNQIIDISKYPSGIYLLQVVHADGVISLTKFVKQ